MNEEKVITLKPDRKNFEEIYFSGNQGVYFSHLLQDPRR